MRSLAGALLVSLFLCAVPRLGIGSAHAQPEPTEEQVAEARSLFEQGLELARQERWGEAVIVFRRSRRLVERASTVFNLASALVRLGRLIEASQALEDYLGFADPTQRADRRRDAQQMLENARASIATLELRVSPASAEVLVDGEIRSDSGQGAHRSVQLDPGSHVLELRADGREPHREELTVEPGARTAREVTLRAIAAVGVVRARRGTGSRRGAGGEREQSSGGVFASPVFWVITGVVVVGAGVGVGVLLLSGPEDPYRGSTGVVVPALTSF